MRTGHKVHLSDEELHELARLRAERRRHAAGEPAPERPLSTGARVADAVAAGMGSWRFIIIQTALLMVWVVLNVIGWIQAWDPYPFILLNLALSFQAAYAAPVIMMSQNRQADIDRERAKDDYSVNVKAELEIELLHEKMDLLREQEIGRLTKIIEDLVQRMDAKPA